MAKYQVHHFVAGKYFLVGSYTNLADAIDHARTLGYRTKITYGGKKIDWYK